jgi:radical SAM protein with 4Fe4S-binding SPASM domain
MHSCENHSSKKYFFPSYGSVLQRHGRTLAFNPNSFQLVEINSSAKFLLEALREPSEINTFFSSLIALVPHWNEEEIQDVHSLLRRWIHIGLLEEFSPEKSKPNWRYNPQLPAEPLEIYVSLTSDCNQRCVYCYNHEIRKKQSASNMGNLSVEEWEEVLRDAKEIGFKSIAFTGGEPLASPILRPITDYTKKLGLETKLLSNGTLIDKEWAKWIREHIDVVNLSLDSRWAEEHDRLRGTGTFQLVQTAVQLLIHYGHERVIVRPVLTAYNVANLPDFVDFVHKELQCRIGPPTIFIPSSPEDLNAKKHLLPDFDVYFEKLLEFIDRTVHVTGKSPWEEFGLDYACRCGVGSSVLSIDPQGDVYPCQALHVAPALAGNLRIQGLKDIYTKSSVLKGIRSLPLDQISKCNECDLLTVCGSGCRAIALNLYGSLTAHSELFCPLYRRGAVEKIWRRVDGKQQVNLISC